MNYYTRKIRLFVPDFSVLHMENYDEFVAYKEKYWGNEIEIEVPESDCCWSEAFELYYVWSYDYSIVS